MSFVKNLQNKLSILSKHFPSPDYLSLRPVAIDISPNAVHLIKLKKTKDGLIPGIHKEVVLDQISDLTDNNITTEKVENIVKALRKLKLEFKSKYVVTSLPEQENYIYVVELPRMAMEDIASAIRFSMEENVPFPVNDVNFDYTLMNVKPKTIEVVVSVFPKRIIQVYTNIFKQAEMLPISFQSESTALARSVVNKNEKKPILLIRMMEDRVNVGIVEQGVVQYTSSIAIPSPAIVGDLNGEKAKQFTQELNKILIYWFTGRKDSTQVHKIEDAIIVGKYALSEDLVDYIENALKIDVEIGNVWSNCFSSEKHVPEISKAESMEYAVTIGLAIRAVKYK